jgi:hypothetical protein
MNKCSPKEVSDFWWLPDSACSKLLAVGLGHHRPIKDEENPGSLVWYLPLEVHKEPSDNPSVSSLDYIDKWRETCNNANVYRTLKIFNVNSGEAVFVGPFLIDIDNSSNKKPYKEDIGDALDIARSVIRILVDSRNMDKGNLRVFFSGRKGFNIEVRPESLLIKGSIIKQIELCAKKLDEIIKTLRNSSQISNGYTNCVSTKGTIIDRIYGDQFGYKLKHPYIRLHNSINRWIRNDDKIIDRMKFELSVHELGCLSADEICRKSEKLASDFLQYGELNHTK